VGGGNRTRNASLGAEKLPELLNTSLVQEKKRKKRHGFTQVRRHGGQKGWSTGLGRTFLNQKIRALTPAEI